MGEMTKGEAIKYGTEWLKDEYLDAKDRAFIKIALEALDQKPCEDCISRKAVIDSLHSQFADGFDSDRWWNSMSVLYAINKISPIKPQEKTGHWIWCVGSHKCSNCEEYTCFSHRELLRYCPNCGCRMVEPQESEEV